MLNLPKRSGQNLTCQINEDLAEEELEEIPQAVDEDHAVTREAPAKRKRGGAAQLGLKNRLLLKENLRC